MYEGLVTYIVIDRKSSCDLTIISHLNISGNSRYANNCDSESKHDDSGTNMEKLPSPSCSALSGVTYLSAEGTNLQITENSSYHTCTSTQAEDSNCATSPISRRGPGIFKMRADRKRKQRSPSPTDIRQKSYIKTGLTGEMEILRVESTSPPKGVTFSTPVSTQKPTKVKGPRFEVLKGKTEANVVSPITPKTPRTPYRTPKSVRRGQWSSDQRILGTPDYLAPELLLRMGHNCAVDWWALGVCFYEFVTGITPFNDETPQQVFKNILEHNIEWPTDEEELSEEVVEAIESLLIADPEKRPKATEVMEMKVFTNISWDNLLSTKPPFVPAPYDITDTGYFQARNELLNFNISNFDF